MEDKVLLEILKTMDENKAKDITYLNVSNFNPLTEYYIIGTVMSNRQALSLANHLKDVLEENDINVKHVEGNQTSDWILVDGMDYIIHIFVNDARNRYGLEKILSSHDIYKVE